MSEEIWVPVKEFKYDYQISNLGNVRSVRYAIDKDENGDIIKSFRVIKKLFQRFETTLYFGGNRYTFQTKDLVAMNFLGYEKGDGSYVIFKDGNKRNCSVDNLDIIKKKQ